MRSLPALGLVAALLLLIAAPSAVPLLIAAPSAVADLPRCTCRDGNACYHYLRAPVTPVNDPCNCPLCRVAPGRCPRDLPKDWDPVCSGNGKMECFLRRHAVSWGISCSERLEGTCACKNPHPESCPFCGKNGRVWGDEGLKIVKRQMEVERRILGPRRKFIIVKSPHFYLVTDIPRLKILTQEAAPRVMGMHEIAHVFIQRAEIAYQDFVRVFGDKVNLPRPSGIYLLEKEGKKRDIATAYFGLPEPELYYGGEIKRIGGGYPYNGCAISNQKYGEDDWLHFQMRHLVGHLLISCWVKVTGNDKYLPRWAYSGVGHWLSRLPAKYGEMANFCSGEGVSVSHSGRKWHLKIVGYAASKRSHPIQRIFDVNALDGLDLQTHIRAWSWFDLFLAEDRERFVAFLAELREGTDHRIALEKTMGLTPEEFEARWRERILGRRPTVAPTAEELDTANPEAPGAEERASIRSETDLRTLAARIRSLQAVNDPLTAATIVPLLRSESELVRETIVLVLGRTRSADVKQWLRTEGLAGWSGIVRAYVARALGDIGDPESGEALLAHAGDGYWLARAHVARALGLVGHEPAVPALRKMVRDSSSKVRIAAMDAIARFGERAASAWEPVSNQLGASAWQLRSAAADCLGALGDMRAVEALIDRMEIESGRIREDIHKALKRITRDNLGRNPKYWRDWWEKVKERHPGGVPHRAEEGGEPSKGEHEYGEDPTYYGLRVFSQGVGYVLDTSGSMAYEIEIDPAWLKRHRRGYPPAGEKFQIAVREIAANLHSLDRRVRINLYFFRTVASRWKKSLIPATPQTVESAIARLKAERPPPGGGRQAYRTNYVDAFRLVLGVKKGDAPPGGFGDTPDTIFFLTDGKPTVGDITDTEILIPWVRELNRFARVKVNVITFGNTDVNPEILERLAQENGGTLVRVPAKD